MGNDSRPRIVVVAQASPAVGGIATFAETVVGDRVLRERFDLELLNTTRRVVRPGGRLSLENVGHAIVDAGRVFRAARHARVVHLQTALLPALPLLRAVALSTAGRLGGAAVLCHVHTGLANAEPNRSFEPTRVEQLLLGRLRLVHRVLTVSDAGSAGLAAHLPGVLIERVDNAVDVGSFAPADPGGSPPRILFVGTLARRKGPIDLLLALQRLQAKGLTEWRLEVVGSGSEAGPSEERLVQEAYGRAGWGSSLVGPLAGEALRDRLRSAQVYVLPSHWEGQPIGVLEAMASGLAIVATSVGAVPEMIQDGVDGLLVPPGHPEALGQALEALLSSKELRARLGASARERARERYDLPILRDRLSGLYRSVLGGEGVSHRPELAKGRTGRRGIARD